MNDIPEKQNEPRQLERLAAQRQLYSTAKRIFGAQVILGAPVAFGWALLVVLFPEVKGFAALWGVAITLADILWLTPWQKQLRESAAKIQEAFDCEVLDLSWNEIKAGKPADYELVKEQAVKFDNGSESTPLWDWYPPVVGDLPIEVARVICQRANCRWDSNQRRRYAAWVIACVIFVSVLVFGLGFIGGMTVEKFFLAIFLPLSPAFILGIRQFTEQTEAANRLDKLKEHADRLWSEACKNESAAISTIKSRALQDEIFENRKRSPLVFDWVFYLVRDRYEEQMNHGAQELAEEAKRKLRLP
jgi:hypothetical protein